MKFDYLTPIYSLFSFYLQTNKKEEAINTCVAAQSASKMIVITPICKQIRKKADTKLASDVVDILKAHPNVTSSKILGFAYSAWIDVVCKWKNSLRKLDQIYDLKKKGGGDYNYLVNRCLAVVYNEEYYFSGEGKMVDEVCALLKESVDNKLQLGNSTVLALRRLKEDLETAGKPVPFTIPE